METKLLTRESHVILQKFIATFLPEIRNNLNRQKVELGRLTEILNTVFLSKFGFEVTLYELNAVLQRLNYIAFIKQSGVMVRADSPYCSTGLTELYYYINSDRLAELRYLVTKNTVKLPLHVLSNIYELDKQIDLFKKLNPARQLAL